MARATQSSGSSDFLARRGNLGNGVRYGLRWQGARRGRASPRRCRRLYGLMALRTRLRFTTCRRPGTLAHLPVSGFAAGAANARLGRSSGARGAYQGAAMCYCLSPPPRRVASRSISATRKMTSGCGIWRGSGTLMRLTFDKVFDRGVPSDARWTQAGVRSRDASVSLFCKTADGTGRARDDRCRNRGRDRRDRRVA